MAISRQRSVEADDSTGPMKAIEEPGKQIDEVPARADYNQFLKEAGFMSEWVTIMLHPSQDVSEVGVPVSVNGNRVYIVPGKPIKVRRFHVNQLLKARPDIVLHRSDDYNAPESELNRMYRQSASRYNFDIVEDTPAGAAWFKAVRANYHSW
jgi:hypothetical protein